MFGKAVLCLTTLQLYCVTAQGDCSDLRGRVISHGIHYVPGPNSCNLCICDNGLPKDCKVVLCSPPQDCRSFRVGNNCCEFICLDDVVKPPDSNESNFRGAAGGAAAVVVLTVLLVLYRVRNQKRRRPPHGDDQRSLTSIGYISGSMGYMGGTCETALGAWKPHGYYLPRGEAPPPYDEAVAQCRQEVMRIQSEAAFHRTYPATVESLTRPDEAMQCVGHGYANIPRPVQQLVNPQNCYNTPLLQAVHTTDARDPNQIQHHPLGPPGGVGFPSAIRLTGSLGTINNRGLLSVLHDHDRPNLYPNPGSLHTPFHRTIPLGGPGADVRRSFHRAPPPRPHTGRSVPRNLDLAAGPHAAPDAAPDVGPILRTNSAGQTRTRSEEQNVGGAVTTNANANAGAAGNNAAVADSAGAVPSAGEGGAPPAPDAPLPPPHNTLPLTVDKPSCVCSYEAPAAPGGEDADDYRSECENCKSASSSKWSSSDGAWEGAGTQTLQRRAPPPPAPSPATATLPQPVTKQSRSLMGQPSNWENWFNAIPDSDSESEEE